MKTFNLKNKNMNLVSFIFILMFLVSCSGQDEKVKKIFQEDFKNSTQGFKENHPNGWVEYDLVHLQKIDTPEVLNPWDDGGKEQKETYLEDWDIGYRDWSMLVEGQEQGLKFHLYHVAISIQSSDNENSIIDQLYMFDEEITTYVMWWESKQSSEEIFKNRTFDEQMEYNMRHKYK